METSGAKWALNVAAVACALLATPVSLRAQPFETRRQLETFISESLAELPASKIRAPLPEALTEIIKANQPESGAFLLTLAADPKRELHRQAVGVLVASAVLLTAEQMTSYLKNALLLEASLRPQYPEGFDVMARMSYGVRYSWDGFPKDLKLKTHTTHLVDGHSLDQYDYQGPQATTGWLHTGKLARGEHVASLKLDFEWEFNGQKGAAKVESEPFPFRIVNATIPDDLAALNSPADQQSVKTAFQVVHDPDAPGADDERPQISSKDELGKSYALQGPTWKLDKALPFALSFDVEIHELETEHVFKGDSIFIPAGETRASYFMPYQAGEFIAGRAGLVPVKIVLLPSYAQALTDPAVKSFFADQIVFDNLHIKIIRPAN